MLQIYLAGREIDNGRTNYNDTMECWIVLHGKDPDSRKTVIGFLSASFLESSRNGRRAWTGRLGIYYYYSMTARQLRGDKEINQIVGVSS